MIMLASTAMKGETMQFLMLPDDLLFNCLARVSRLYYPTLALVSKRFRSLLASLERYKTRTLLGYTESCLYVCLYFHDEPNPVRWFTLCRRPIQMIPKSKPKWFTPCFAPYASLNENYLVSIATRISPYVDWWGHKGVVALGYNIYYVGGVLNGSPSSRVLYMDCRSHTWHEAPSMLMARTHPHVSVLDGKIYVVESYTKLELDFSNWVECFDPITQIWEHVPSPDAKICGRFIMYKSLAIEGKLHLFGSKNAVYKPKENEWDVVPSIQELPSWGFNSCCVIDNVFYCYGLSEKFEWYAFEARSWRDLKGLEKLPKLRNGRYAIKMVDYSGKIMVLWENEMGEEKTICCAEILPERRSKHEIHGKIQWSDVVATVPKSCYALQFLAVTV